MLELHELAMNSASLVDWKGEGLLREYDLQLIMCAEPCAQASGASPHL